MSRKRQLENRSDRYDDDNSSTDNAKDTKDMPRLSPEEAAKIKIYRIARPASTSTTFGAAASTNAFSSLKETSSRSSPVAAPLASGFTKKPAAFSFSFDAKNNNNKEETGTVCPSSNSSSTTFSFGSGTTASGNAPIAFSFGNSKPVDSANGGAATTFKFSFGSSTTASASTADNSSSPGNKNLGTFSFASGTQPMMKLSNFTGFPPNNTKDKKDDDDDIEAEVPVQRPNAPNNPLANAPVVSKPTEEGEELLKVPDCKVFLYKATEKVWAERGIGDLVISKAKEKPRLTMHRSQTLACVLNLPLNHTVSLGNIKENTVHIKALEPVEKKTDDAPSVVPRLYCIKIGGGGEGKSSGMVQTLVDKLKELLPKKE